MKSAVFDLRFPGDAPDRMKEPDVKFPIPTLAAYAIEYAEFTFQGGFHEHKALTDGHGITLKPDGIIWHGFFEPNFPGMDWYRLVVHYHGIRDYPLLFPHVPDAQLRERLGKFYEEADTGFDNGLWLSFALMCGALYEGLLYAHFGKSKKLAEMIELAHAEKIIDDAAARIMHEARELRNLVHADKSPCPFVSRLQAMDMRKVMDRLIQDAWRWPKTK